VDQVNDKLSPYRCYAATTRTTFRNPTAKTISAFTWAAARKAKTPYSSIYLSTRHYKLVDLVTSQEHLEDSIALAQKLFSRLEDYNYRILLANADDNFVTIRIETDEIPENKKEEYYSNAPSRPRVNTVAYLGTVAIGLTIVEMTELVTMKDNSFYSYTSTKKVASRKYRVYAYSPYRHTELVKSWQDTKNSKLAQRLDEIVGEMEAMARQIPTLIIEGENRAAEAQAKIEAEQREYQRKRALEARKKAEVESRNDLGKLIAAWATVKNQQGFIDEIIRALDKEAPEIKDELSARLASAKDLLGTKSVTDLIRSWETPNEKFALLSSWERGDDV
jgi:aspartokinase